MKGELNDNHTKGDFVVVDDNKGPETSMTDLHTLAYTKGDRRVRYERGKKAWFSDLCLGQKK